MCLPFSWFHAPIQLERAIFNQAALTALLKKRATIVLMDRSGLELGDKDLRALLSWLEKQQIMDNARFNLSGSGFNETNFRLLQALLADKCLEGLVLKKVGLTPQRLANFECSFHQLSVKELVLDGNTLSGLMVSQLPDPIESLSLNRCQLGDNDIPQLIHCLKKLPKLESLSLSGNKFTHQGIAALILAAKTLALKAVDFSRNNIGSQPLTVILKAVKETECSLAINLSETQLSLENQATFVQFKQLNPDCAISVGRLGLALSIQNDLATVGFERR